MTDRTEHSGNGTWGFPFGYLAKRHHVTDRSSDSYGLASSTIKLRHKRHTQAHEHGRGGLFSQERVNRI
jgi:hypothetical protein